MNNVKKVIPIIILFISGCANHNVFAPFLIPSPIGGSNGKVLLYGGTPEQKYYKFPTLTGKDYLFQIGMGLLFHPLFPRE